MSKQDKKELRQQIACEWLEENYLQFGSLRHDVVTDRLQIRIADSLEDGSAYSLEAGGDASPKSSPEGKDLALKTNKMPE